MRRPRGAARVDRWAQLVEVWFRAHATLVYLFLYLPILIVVVFSFNANRLATIWTGFSTEWYAVALGDRTVQRALVNSFLIAVPNAVLATIFGTMAALGLQRVSKGVRLGFDGLTYVSIIVPEVVIALSTLVLFASAFDVINPTLIALQVATTFKLGLGHFTIIAAHVLFNISLVLLLVRARLSGMDRTPGRCERGPVRDPLADLPSDHLPAAAAGHRRGLPAVVHVQLRRLRDHLVRVRAWVVDAAAVRLRPGQARGLAGDECRGGDDAG